MKKTRVGKTSVEVTDLAFGTSGLGSMPDTYGYAVDEERAYATVNAIFDGAAKANVLDTARNYGFGRSEERVGKVIRDRGGIPDGFVISTKIDRDMETNRLDAARTRQSFEQSLETLGVDRIQILHLHDPEYCRSIEEITRKGGALDELFKIKEEGLVDAVGLAMGNVDIMFPILRDRPFDCLISHNRFTLINRAAQEMFDYAAENGITVLNAAPFSGGVLAKGSQDVKRIAYTDVDEAGLAPVRKIEEICAEAGVPMGAAALQYSMRDPRIASTIIGVTKPERVAQTLEWASHPISDATWEKLLALPFAVDDPEANRDYKPG